MPTRLSQSPLLNRVGTATGTIVIAYGINALFRPEHALSFFEFDYPTTGTAKSTVDNLMLVYGARDIFMGLATYIAGYYGNSKTLGWTIMAISAVAYVDGIICWANGQGEWTHWGYAPILSGLASVLLGVLDRN